LSGEFKNVASMLAVGSIRSTIFIVVSAEAGFDHCVIETLWQPPASLVRGSVCRTP
jgi:hypothetical protein